MRQSHDWKRFDTAETAVAIFAEKYAAKCDKAVAYLLKEHDALLSVYDFPAEHWDHLRTSHSIESVFATMRHRTILTKGALLQDTARLMVFQLVMMAMIIRRRLKGENQLPKVIHDVKVRNGVEVAEEPAKTAARSPRHPVSSKTRGKPTERIAHGNEIAARVPSTGQPA